MSERPKAVTYNNSVYLVIDGETCAHFCAPGMETYTLENPFTGFRFKKCSGLVTSGDHRTDKRLTANESEPTYTSQTFELTDGRQIAMDEHGRTEYVVAGANGEEKEGSES